MATDQLGVLILFIYLALLLVVTITAKLCQRNTHLTDYYLASRDLGLFVLFLTLYASYNSGNNLIGYPGEAYRSGFIFVLSVGFMVAISFSLHAIVPKLRPLAIKHQFISPGDWVNYRFPAKWGSVLRIGIGLVMALALFNFLIAELKATGLMTVLLTDGKIGYWQGVLILGVFILGYESFGGLRAVAWTDAIQGILILIGLALLCFWLYQQLQGIDDFALEITRVDHQLSAVPNLTSKLSWLSTIILVGLSAVLYPHALQRIFAAKNAYSLKFSLAILSFMPFITTAVVLFVGVAAIVIAPGLEAASADDIVPILLHQWSTLGGINILFANLVFLAALAAIMSTADSILLALSMVILRDILGQDKRDTTTQQTSAKRGKQVSLIIMLIVVPLALLLQDISLWGLIQFKLEWLIQCAPVFFFGLRWQWLDAKSALLGLVMGCVWLAFFSFLGGGSWFGINVGLYALTANILTIALSKLYQLSCSVPIVESGNKESTRC